VKWWSESVRRLAINTVLHPGGYTNGLFLDSCRHHTRCWNQVQIDGVTAVDAFGQWCVLMLMNRCFRIGVVRFKRRNPHPTLFTTT
jgi:hypothetical protein